MAPTATSRPLGDRGPADWSRRRANHPRRWATLRESTIWDGDGARGETRSRPAAALVCQRRFRGGRVLTPRRAMRPEGGVVPGLVFDGWDEAELAVQASVAPLCVKTPGSGGPTHLLERLSG